MDGRTNAALKTSGIYKFVDDPTGAYGRLKEAKIVKTTPSKTATPSQYRYHLQPDPNIFRGQTDVPGLDKVDRNKVKVKVDEFAEHMCPLDDLEEEMSDKGLESIQGIFQACPGTQIRRPYLTSYYHFPEDHDHDTLGNHGGADFIVGFQNHPLEGSPMPVLLTVACAAQTHRCNMNPYEDVYNGWRVPSLAMTVISSDVTFHAIITIGHQYRTIPLTPTLSCLSDASDGDDRKKLYSAFTAALVLLACIQEYSARYVASPPPKIPENCHRYPAVTELRHYGSNGTVKFQIKGFHTDRQSYRLLYLATTEDGQLILVKCTRHYCIELHHFCARRKLSPQILGFERLPSGWYAIAMEYFLPVAPLLAADGLQEHGRRWIAELRDLVESFHAAGFVHGDLRDANIICDGEQAFLIDFDWAGKAREVSYPVDLENLNPDLLKDRTSTKATITVDDDIRVLRLRSDSGMCIFTHIW
ncbi:hypothetical protein H0H81_004858 [Sphagnurus paluster]|uniref:Aminoglycoside phosphotransferase domain-containing protein n=1 Tax=Sphagnurus paluster TaxID=117069 RepID=A0A9P7GG09_9AGAR|nr:hypothetical protein H0H81_004858 [Sphagnurus paluster]